MVNKTETDRIKKVALYARVSTEEQTENFSLAAQIELLKKHASDNGYEIFGEYIDGGYSGTSFERPEFRRLLDDARQNKFGLIIVYKIDRFFRSNKDLLNVVYELESIGVNIKSITEPFDTSNYLGKFVLSLFGSIAELERNTFLERSKIGKLRRYREGYYSGVQPTKFGYNYNKETKKLEINEKEAEAVNLVFSLYNQPDSSILKVTKTLRKLGYKAKEGSLMREDVVHSVLRDNVYTGKWYANRFGKGGKLKPRNEWIEVEVPRIITDELFERSQHLLITRRNYCERNAKYNYLLQGIAKCGDCGNSLAGTADKKFDIKDGQRVEIRSKLYYRCTHFSKNKYDKVVDCRLKYLQAQKLESAVWQKIEEILQKPELIEKLVQREVEIKAKNKKALQQRIKKIQTQQDALEAEERRILEAYRQNIINVEQLKEQIETINKNRENFKKTAQELEELLQHRDTSAEAHQAIDYVRKLKAGIDKFNYETKKKILHLLNTRIKVNITGIVDILLRLPKDISTAILQPTALKVAGDSLPCIDSPRPIF